MKTLIKTTVLVVALSAVYGTTAFAEEATKAEAAKAAVEHHTKEAAKPEHKEMAEKAEHHAKEAVKPEHKEEKK